jgi:hypothetical protein
VCCVLMSLLGRMWWGYERILRIFQGSSQVIPNLRWEIDQKLDSGMICGVGTRPQKKPFQFYLVLHV